MADLEEIETFLAEFKAKAKIFGILYSIEREKNINTMLALNITAEQREKIVLSIEAKDYSEGPIMNMERSKTPLWVFGKTFRGKEIYIKISKGTPDNSSFCISFHIAEYKMMYPFK